MPEKEIERTLEIVKHRRKNANGTHFSFRNFWGPESQPQPFNMLDLDDVDWLIKRVEALEEEVKDLKMELREEMP